MPIAARCAATRLGASCGQSPRRARELEGEQAADRHRLAVQQPVGIAGRGLERMAEGMAEVEERAVALLGLVAGDDLGLHLAGAPHRVLPRAGVAGLAAPAPLASSQAKKSASPRRPYFATSP